MKNLQRTQLMLMNSGSEQHNKGKYVAHGKLVVSVTLFVIEKLIRRVVISYLTFLVFYIVLIAKCLPSCCRSSLKQITVVS